jgi:hypothetical protein
VLVERPHWRVCVRAIDGASAAFIEACSGRASIEVALERARALDAAFPIDSRLAEWVRAGVIVDFELDRS